MKSNYGRLNDSATPWGDFRLKDMDGGKHVVGSVKRTDKHWNIDVTVSKWVLEVKVDRKLVSVKICFYLVMVICSSTNEYTTRSNPLSQSLLVQRILARCSFIHT